MSKTKGPGRVYRYLAAFFGICPLPARTKGRAADFSYGDGAPPSREGVIVLHGIFRNSANMGFVQLLLNEAGYDVLNIDYPSRTLPITALANGIADDVASFAKDYDRVHFVGHSMGGLMTRAVLKERPLPNTGRVVMMGTPNHGSRIADVYQHVKPMMRLMGPALLDLRTTEDFDGKYGRLEGIETGIIAGTRVIDHVNSWPIRKAPHDGKVTVASTHLAGEADHITLPAAHELMPVNSRVIRQAIAFLRTGRFVR